MGVVGTQPRYSAPVKPTHREMKTDWKKPEYDGLLHNCSTASRIIKMNRRIGVGFGFAGVTKDSEIIWCEHNEEWKDLPTLMRFENMARKDPDHDWRCHLDSLLHGEIFQRHDRNRWVLIISNAGFA